MTNPYDPQNPVKPDFFGGRKHVLETAAIRIDKARSQKQSGGILVYGYRGAGKTSILTKIRSMILPAPDKPPNNTLSIYRRLSKTTSDSELYQMITEDLLDEIQQRKSVIDKLRSFPESVVSVKTPVVDIGFRLEQNWKDITPYHRWRSLVRSVEKADFILVAIDDADYLSPEALGNLKSIVEEQSRTPILLLVSGGVEFEERLVDDYSPVSRIFSGASFNIGEFEFDEIKEVLQNPLADQKTSWTDDGLKQAYKLSRGYPYLVQCIASASYLEGDAINASRVKDSLKAALNIGKPWLSHELETASDNDFRSFLKIAESSRTTFKSSELGDLGVSPPYVGRLVSLGVLKRISRGRYDLVKPPIIAYYHILTRGISV
jgi:hypothetical protein